MTIAHRPASASAGPLDRAAQRPVRYIIDARGLPAEAGEVACPPAVTERFAFRTNDYYASLIDWSDPADPIRRLIVPNPDEMIEFGSADASNEAANTKMLGLQHKYADTAILLVTDQCAGFCRYCFRKRLFVPGSRETNRDVEAGLDYIRAHPEITDVLLTGGDPLTLSTPRLRAIVEAVRGIDHVHTIRLGSKMPAFNPYRILDDSDLQLMFAEQSDRPGRIYVVAHFDHPREFTPPAREAIALLRSLGVMCINQAPLTAGINDDVDVLAELFQACTDAGCPQYYVFQCRPAFGNAPFEVPMTRGFELVAAARARLSGLSRRARYCMSHASGKIEIVGVDDARIFLRYHRAKDPADENRVVVMKRDDEAYWFDQLVPANC